MKLRLMAMGAMVAAAFALSGTSANADGAMRARAYNVEPFTSWSGFYVGAHAGGAWTDIDWNNVSLTNERVRNDTSSFIGGGQFGYNQQYGSVVLGAEVSVSGTSLEHNFTSLVNPAVTFSTDVHTIVTATGKLGFARDQWMIYGKGGWAGAKVDVSGNNTAISDSFSFNDWRNGWTWGAGVDYMIRPNISLGVEYSFIDLGDDNFVGNTTGKGKFPFTITDHHVEIQAVTARLNFHFYRDEYRDYRPLK